MEYVKRVWDPGARVLVMIMRESQSKTAGGSVKPVRAMSALSLTSLGALAPLVHRMVLTGSYRSKPAGVWAVVYTAGNSNSSCVVVRPSGVPRRKHCWCGGCDSVICASLSQCLEPGMRSNKQIIVSSEMASNRNVGSRAPLAVLSAEFQGA